jgi:hypothetical protein
MTSNYIQLVLYLVLAIILFCTDASTAEDLLDRITAAYQRAGSRRLMPGTEPDSSQKQLDKLTTDYDLMWKSDLLGVKVTFKEDCVGGKAILKEIECFEDFDCRDCSCSGWSNLNRCIAIINNLVEVSAVSASVTPQSSEFSGSGSVKTGAFAATQIKQMLRKHPELTGAGVKIGIISDSFNRLPTRPNEEDDITSGDLPGGSNRVKILYDLTAEDVENLELEANVPITLKDEGRAMAQLIYDLAPEAQMVFHSGFLPGNNFAPAIEALVEEGCDIIVDDVRFDLVPYFQLGKSEKAAKKAVEENGIAYFTSARNFGDRSWENRGFKDSPCPPWVNSYGNYTSCHDFGESPVPVPFPTLQFIPLFQKQRFVFQWDDPWQSISGPPGPQTDLDVFLFNAENISQVIASTENNLNADAYEYLGSPDPGQYFLAIAKRSGPSPNLMKWIAAGLDYDPLRLGNSGTITEVGNVPGVAAVGAASEKQVFGEIPELQAFSSIGGVPLIFDDDGNRTMEELVLDQPRFVGPDGSYTTFFGTDYPFEASVNDVTVPPAPPKRFIGTSCSVANVAAVGAILIQATSVFNNTEVRRLKTSKSVKKSGKTLKKAKSSKSEVSKDFLLPFDLYKIMEESAIDMNEPGSGHGFVNAFAAVEAIKKNFGGEIAEGESCSVIL